MTKEIIIYTVLDKIGLHGSPGFSDYEGIGMLDIISKWFFRFFDVFLGFIAIGGGFVLSIILCVFVLSIIGRKLFTLAVRFYDRRY